MERNDTDRDAVNWALLAVRVVIGIIFMAHGSQKLFGAFGGPGLATLMQNWQQGPPFIGFLVAFGEFFGGLGLLVGFLSRFSAASLIVIMLGAIAFVHGKNGFFAGDNGFELHLALIGLLLPILIAGPGALTIGRRLPLPKKVDTGRPIPALE